MAKFKENREEQMMLLPPSLHDFVPEGHLARLINMVVGRLDTTVIEDKYSERGQNTYHPGILIKLLFYGYARGERSGRKISQRCETDTAYMYLGQMYKPNFRTINDFRKNNIEELSEYFVEIVRISKEMGLLKIGQVNIDGTKLKANAANKLTMSKDGYEKWEKRIKEKIEKIIEEAESIDEEEDRLYGDKRGDELPEEINTSEKLNKKLEEIQKKREQIKEGEKQNYTDRDAQFMRNGRGQIEVGYNCQIGVTENRIIVGSEVIMDKADDKALELIVKTTEENVEQKVKEVAADAGYGTYENYEYLSKEKKTGYIPDQSLRVQDKRKKNPYYHEHFRYDKDTDEYVCPEGKGLKRYKYYKKERKIAYRGVGCNECVKRSLCTKHKNRFIMRDERIELLKDMRQRLSTDQGKAKYGKRLYTVEPVFGHLKHNLGYRQFLLRGIKKVKAEFRLMCIGANLKKMQVLLAAQS
ncbi:MAG: IS1182 family transposase [Candidatus Omnitrophota bacterium]